MSNEGMATRLADGFVEVLTPFMPLLIGAAFVFGLIVAVRMSRGRK